MQCWECGQARKMHFTCETCGAGPRGAKARIRIEMSDEDFELIASAALTKGEPMTQFILRASTKTAKAALRQKHVRRNVTTRV